MENKITNIGKKPLATATFGAGCFWCVEAIFQRLNGVKAVESGYTGGNIINPTYEQVCSGRSGHAEVCRITFDSETISFEDLLEVFWKTHDPTTLNCQGNDSGTQYRSAIFGHNTEQLRIAEDYRETLDESGIFDDPIVTEIVPISEYYKAENYHQNYFNSNSQQPYCTHIIQPKVDKLQQVFRDKLKN